MVQLPTPGFIRIAIFLTEWSTRNLNTGEAGQGRGDGSGSGGLDVICGQAWISRPVRRAKEWAHREAERVAEDMAAAGRGARLQVHHLPVLY